jgi:hypothetical protein
MAPFPANTDTKRLSTGGASEGAGAMSTQFVLPEVPPAPDLRVTVRRGQDSVWIEIRGEADLSSFASLQAGLADVALDGVRVVHLHLAHLRFADVDSTCELTWFADRLQVAGDEVMVCGASHTLAKVARLVALVPDLWST